MAMDYTLQELDEMCGRIDRLAEQIAHPGFGTREESAVSEVVQLIQRMGECIAWAYGQHARPGQDLGERFAQPFVDRKLRDRLKALLERKPLRRELQNHISAQILQTIHILLQATPPYSTLFCNLTANWYLNEVVSAPFDFNEHEDLLPLWMTVVKDIAAMLNRENMMLFFDETSQKPFPIFSEAIRYYHHPVSQVRTHVQATSLEVFLKLRDKDLWTDPIFQLVLEQSSVLFTHVCCLLRDFWCMADEAIRHGNRREIRSALYIQNDMLMYINDVFMCEIPQMSVILQEKLLRFAVLPVLIRSILTPPSSGEQPKDMISLHLAWYLLYDMLSTLQSSAVLAAVASILLRPELPDEVLQLVSAAPPRTPSMFFTWQNAWGGSAQATHFERAEPRLDESLYMGSPIPVKDILDNRMAPRPLVHAWPLDTLEQRLNDLSAESSGAPKASMAGSVLGATALLLRTLHSSGEALDGTVAERLSKVLCGLLVLHRQLPWAALSGALCALHELVALADTPSGRAHELMGASVREKVLAPIAKELLAVCKQPPGSLLELWLDEFQEQWDLHQSSPAEPPPIVRQRELLEQSSAGEGAGTPMGRARSVRALLGARRLAATLDGIGDQDKMMSIMPGLGETELEESARFQAGVPVHIGKMNRVKCQVRGSRRGAEPEALYLLPMQALLVLVRPDDQKPFWAVPVIAEPLRRVKLSINEKPGPLQQIMPASANVDEGEPTLHLEVTKPQSPFLKAYGYQQHGPPEFALGGPGMNAPDRLCTTMAGPAQGLLATPVAGQDRMAMSVPAVPTLGAAREDQVSVSLHFADERRRRVACKIIAQARHAVCQRMSEGLETFLAEIHTG